MASERNCSGQPQREGLAGQDGAEGIDGTNETIHRGGKLAKETAVVVKVSKPNQDMRFDVPAVGPDTIEVMAQVKASVLAIEAGKTLIFDKLAMISYADRSRIVIVSL